MKPTVLKLGSARTAWLGLFLVSASAGLAQGNDEAKNVDNANTVVTATNTAAPSEADQTATAANPAAQPAGDGLNGNFFQRLGDFYWADWTSKAPNAPAPARRMLDAPLDSPPFPSSDWGY